MSVATVMLTRAARTTRTTKRTENNMGEKQNDGGPAYPCSVRKIENYMDEGGYGRERTVTVVQGGMSLRDWFAGQALAAWIASADAFNDECRERGSSTRIGADDTAKTCYQYADAMLKARAE